MFRLSKNWKTAPIVAFAAVMLLTSCGQKKFNKLSHTATAVAGQYIYIKPQLDLVVFQDNSDSMTNALNQVKPQLESFLANLDTNWEYRFIVLPLQGTQPLSSKHIIATDCTGIGAAACLSPSQASYFNSLGGDHGWINNRNSAVGNTDLGFQNMAANLNALWSSGFIRPGAALATVVISNGEDVSGGVNYITRPDGAVTSVNYSGALTINSMNYYKGVFQGLKTSFNLPINRFYAVVAGNRYADCYGGGMTWAGIRYMDMASHLSGLSFDLCQGGLPRVLEDLRGQLVTVVQTIVFNYVKLDDQPVPNTITLKKNGQSLPNSAVNGWTYAGYLSNQPTSYSPALGNYKSGYMIRLHGTAEFKGTDTIEIDYQKQ